MGGCGAQPHQVDGPAEPVPCELDPGDQQDEQKQMEAKLWAGYEVEIEVCIDEARGEQDF